MKPFVWLGSDCLQWQGLLNGDAVPMPDPEPKLFLGQVENALNRVQNGTHLTKSFQKKRVNDKDTQLEMLAILTASLRELCQSSRLANQAMKGILYTQR